MDNKINRPAAAGFNKEQYIGKLFSCIVIKSI